MMTTIITTIIFVIVIIIIASFTFLCLGASTKNFCHTQQILANKWVGGLSESAKKGKPMMKILFSDNVE